jgi:hypothetical protein
MMASEPFDDPLDARVAMADWDARFKRWQHDEGLKAMRESDDPETRRLAEHCNCLFCKPRPIPGRGREGLR